MTISLVGATTGTIADVQINTRAQIVTRKPVYSDFKGSYFYSAAVTGTAITASTTTVDFFLLNLSSVLSSVRRVSVSLATVAPTTQGVATFNLIRSTAVFSAGSVNATGFPLRSSFPSSACRISNSGFQGGIATSPGTPDLQPLSSITITGSTTGPISSATGYAKDLILYDAEESYFPLILEYGEAVSISFQTGGLALTSGSPVEAVNFKWDEYWNY